MTAPTPTPTPLWLDLAETPVPGDIATVAGTVELGDKTTGPFTARWRDDWERGATEYVLTGPRLCGIVTATFALRRAWIGHEIHAADLSDAFLVCFTYRTDTIDDEHRDPTPTEHLTINGIALEARLSITEARLGQPHGINRTNFNLRRRHADSSAAEVEIPDRTRQRAEAVVASILNHWRRRDPHAGLMRLARIQDRLADFRVQAGYRKAALGHRIRAAQDETAALERQIATAAAIERLPVGAAAAAALTDLTAWARARAADDAAPDPACDCHQSDQHCRCGHTRFHHIGNLGSPPTECRTGTGCDTACLEYRECACRCQWHGHPHRLTPAHRAQCAHCAAASATPGSTAPALPPEEFG